MTDTLSAPILLEKMYTFWLETNQTFYNYLSCRNITSHAMFGEDLTKHIQWESSVTWVWEPWLEFREGWKQLENFKKKN